MVSHRVRDQLPRWQGIFHPFVTHGNPVIDTDGVEYEGHSPRIPNRLFDEFPDRVQVYMTGTIYRYNCYKLR